MRIRGHYLGETFGIYCIVLLLSVVKQSKQNKQIECIIDKKWSIKNESRQVEDTYTKW